MTFGKPQNKFAFYQLHGQVAAGSPAAANWLDVDRQERQPLKIDRKHARVITRIPCEVGPTAGELDRATILDVSVGGLKFACSQATITHILPDERFLLGRIMDVEVVLHFDLEAPAESGTSIACRARLIHSERLAQDLFHVGVQFLDLKQAALAALQGYIEKHTLTPAPAGD